MDYTNEFQDFLENFELSGKNPEEFGIEYFKMQVIRELFEYVDNNIQNQIEEDGGFKFSLKIYKLILNCILKFGSNCKHFNINEENIEQNIEKANFLIDYYGLFNA